MKRPPPKPDDPRGWGWPTGSRKAHFFVGKHSICGWWEYSGKLTGWVIDETACRNCSKRLDDEDNHQER